MIETNDSDADICPIDEIDRLFQVKFNKVVDLKENDKNIENYGLHLSLSNNYQNVCVGFTDQEAPIYQITSTGLTKTANYSRLKTPICKVRFFNQDPNLLLIASTNGDISLNDIRTDKVVYNFEGKFYLLYILVL